MPAWASIVAWAFEPRISWAQRRWSNETDSPKRSINSAGPALNRPPQVTWAFFRADMTKECPQEGGQASKDAQRLA